MRDATIPARPTHPWVAAGQDTRRFGVAMLRPRPDWDAFVAWVLEAEALGFDSVWAQDHPPAYTDCWTTLAALAMRTTTIRLGSLVSCIYYRSPVLLARLASDVDRMSHGRLVLGVGIGDVAEEFAQLGLSYPPVPTRQQALEETLQIVRGLWGPQPFTFTGAHFQVQAVTVQPPMQQPHVPLLIAGGGERVTLRQVAHYGDVANFGANMGIGSAFTLADVRRKVAALDAHCAAVDRPTSAVLRSHLVLPLVLGETPAAVQAKVDTIPPAALAVVQSSLVAGTPEAVLPHYHALAEAGMQYFIATLLPYDTETLRLLAARIIPAMTVA